MNSDMPAQRPVKTIALLSAAHAIAGSQQSLVMAAGALVGVRLAPDPAFATMPPTAMIVGLALTAGPAAFVIHRLGRKRAFLLGGGLSVLAGLLAALGILVASFPLFLVALALVGGGAAFAQQYRFAAADSVPETFKGKAISFVLVGGVFSGFLGPGLSRYGRTLIEGADYVGSFLAMAGLALIAMAVLTQTDLARVTRADSRESQRSIWEILRAPEVFTPILTAMASYGLMTFVMVAAPLAMVVACGHSPDDAANAIQWHVVAMFAPGFATGSIIARIGARATTGIGLTLILGCALIALNGITTWHFDLALILLGVGWNFGFIGSTTMLARSYRPEDSAKVQALNEQLVFGVMAIASISSGVLLQTIGWQSINVLSIPVATAAIALLAWGDWHARKQAA